MPAGRPRKPTAIKALSGTLQPCRTNQNEPKLDRGIPLPPSHLNAVSKRAWRQICQVLDEMGVLTLADSFAVEGLATTYTELLAARKALKARGSLTYETVSPTGGIAIRPYPEVAIVSDLDKRFRTWLSAVGATPSDRSKVSAVAKDDALDDFRLFVE